jgi:hypothetical protein
MALIEDHDADTRISGSTVGRRDLQRQRQNRRESLTVLTSLRRGSDAYVNQDCIDA